MSFDVFLIELLREIANAAVQIAVGVVIHIVLCKIGNPRNNIGIAFLLLANATEDIIHGLLYHFIAVQCNVICGGEPQV